MIFVRKEETWLDHAKYRPKIPAKNLTSPIRMKRSVMKKEAWSSDAFRSLKAAVETGGNKARNRRRAPSSPFQDGKFPFPRR
jgi:hypothetical protein